MRIYIFLFNVNNSYSVGIITNSTDEKSKFSNIK